MSTVIRDPVVIDCHLVSLRAIDRRTMTDHFARLSTSSSTCITIEAGAEDTWRDSAIPLRHVLSLFDDDRRRGRVSEISINPFHQIGLVERRRAWAAIHKAS
jgi:hypothetical protein